MRLSKQIYLLALVLTLGLSACVKQKFTTPALAEFASSSTANVGAYFIPNDPNTVFKIPIGITTPSNVARVINFTVTSPSGAVAGQQYTLASNSITLPAGAVVDSIPIQGIFAGYPVGRIDTLIFTITAGDAPIFTQYSTYTLTMQKYCPVALNDLLGTYTNCAENAGGTHAPISPYTVTITGTSTGPTSATIYVKNLGYGAFAPFLPSDATTNPGIMVNLDWSNPANFTATIPTQPCWLDPSYGPATMGSGVGTFSSCANTFTLQYSVSVAAGTYGDFITTIAR